MVDLNSDHVIEQIPADEPDLPLLIREIQTAQSDATPYIERFRYSADWWFCQWPNQSIDGRQWASAGQDPAKIYPWNGCSDSRLRIVDTIIQEHVTLTLAAFWGAKVQAKSNRPFVYGHEVNTASRVLNYLIKTKMKRELLSELRLALEWRFGFGLSFLSIYWEQIRERVEVAVDLQMLQMASQQLGLGDIVSQILDPNSSYDKDLIGSIQKLSPICTTAEARGVLRDLRNTGSAQLPVTSLRVNRPKWTALRPFVDITFPSETGDLQSARWVSRRELVSEAELTDRIVTDGYNPDFVDESLKHKGNFHYYLPGSNYQFISPGSDRDLVELIHIHYRTIHNGIPCTYRTVFNEPCVGTGLYATHRPFEYEHQQYPYVAMRRSAIYRPLLSSMGIAEEAYTDELDLKSQQDGLNNRTDLIHQPPMIVPTQRAQAVQNTYGPRAIMTAMRPEGIVFPPLPPMDQTPLLVMQMVEARLNRRYAIIGGEVDPEIKALRRQQIGNDVLGETELACEQTLQLAMQYLSEEEAQEICGPNCKWQYNPAQIRGQHDISATADMKILDLEYGELKLQMLTQLLPLRQLSPKVFNAGANMIDPDIADMLGDEMVGPTAQQRETDDEYNAVAQIMAGIEPQKNTQANPQLRMQVMQQILQDPMTQQKLQQDEVAQKRIENRVKFYEAQIAQYQQNPTIGRALSTTTFNSKQAPALQLGPPGAGT